MHASRNGGSVNTTDTLSCQSRKPRSALETGPERLLRRRTAQLNTHPYRSPQMLTGGDASGHYVHARRNRALGHSAQGHRGHPRPRPGCTRPAYAAPPGKV
jgi:hypothetical protein